MRVDGAQFTQVGPQGDDRLAGATQQQGTWRGETLTVQNSPASLLADAAEELTFAQAEHEEEKEVSERRVRAGGSVDIPQIQEIMELLDLMGDKNSQAKLEELLGRLRGSGGAGAAQAVRDAFPDVSQQFLALGYLARRFEQEGDAATAAALREELETLFEDRAPHIQAGLNTAAVAGEFAAGDSDRAASFRECYRETVLGREALGETFNAILERFGADDVKRTIDFLVRAAGDDLAARGPSTPPAELRSIIEDLYQLEVLATVLENCHEMRDAMARDFGVQSIAVDQLMRRLVGLTGERWVTSDRFAGLARDMGAAQAPASIAFLTRVKGIVREMPLKVFADPESREKLLNAVQEALDLAIEEEDE